jgi:acetyl-CoA carboxylase carboxyl transferase subunit alpha
MKMTAANLLELGIVSDIIPEPPGGAHTNPKEASKALDHYLQAALGSLSQLSPEERIELRYQRFRNIGFYR